MLGTNMVNHNVNSVTAGKLLDSLGNILLGVVDNGVRTQFPRLGGLLLGAGSSNDPSAYHVL